MNKHLVPSWQNSTSSAYAASNFEAARANVRCERLQCVDWTCVCPSWCRPGPTSSRIRDVFFAGCSMRVFQVGLTSLENINQISFEAEKRPSSSSSSPVGIASHECPDHAPRIGAIVINIVICLPIVYCFISRNVTLASTSKSTFHFMLFFMKDL